MTAAAARPTAGELNPFRFFRPRRVLISSPGPAAEPPGAGAGEESRELGLRVIAGESDVVLVLGRASSPDCRHLVEVARSAGVPAWLVESTSAMRMEWLDGVTTLGVVAVAPAASEQVEDLLTALRELGPITVEGR